LPPDAPIATVSPRVKREVESMVSCTSVSKIVMKQEAQSLVWSFGRRTCARAVLQTLQIEGGIFTADSMFSRG